MDREQSILKAVAALPPMERCGFLEVVCAGQPGLRMRIEARLRSDETDTIQSAPGSPEKAAEQEMIATWVRPMR